MSERDDKRFFSEKQRQALFLAADGKSEASGRPLDDGWHADHVQPWSQSGKTDVLNGQALAPEENLAKGAGVRLRAWQRDFVATFKQHVGVDFMLSALPGGGKTIASLYPAREFLNGSRDRRLIVVVPTSSLREQWRDEAWKSFGIRLQTIEFRGTLKTDFDGVVTTYASVASNPHLFRRLCAQHECMVIFDEIHHAGDKSTWGISIKDAFESASKRLAMSGTPFKSDGQLIPFLTVEPTGLYRIDFQYDYPRALRDGVVREVSFHHYSGSVTLAVGEDIFDIHTEDDVDQDMAAKRLRGLLRSTKFTRDLLREAHEKLVSVRRSKPNAGALALCIDANHAVLVAGLLKEITGEQPDIIVSDDDLATSSVKDYRSSTRKWVVAVKMVSEGIDIKRLMVLAYLTNTATELFFRQAIGRIVRSEGTDFDTESYCYFPDDPRLEEFAGAIEEFQRTVVAEQEEEERRERESSEPAERVSIEVLDSSGAEFSGITTRGERKETERSLEILSLSEEFGIEEGKMSALFDRLVGSNAPPSADAPTTVEPEEHPEDVLARLRRSCAKMANKLAMIRGVEPKAVHADYMRIANVGQGGMTIKQLEGKRAWLLKQINEIGSR